MDLLWDACYKVGLTNSPSLASIPVFPEHCQRNLYQYYEVSREIIGQGSFGHIRRVKLRRNSNRSKKCNGNDASSDSDTIYDRYYACKTLPKSKMYDRELYLREVYNLNRCQTSMTTTSHIYNDEYNNNNTHNDNNNHIIRLLDVLEDRHSVHIITELCEGGELYDYIVKEHRRTGRGLRGKALSLPPNHGDEIDADDDELRCATVIFQILTAFRLIHDAGICHRDMKASNFMFVHSPSLVSNSLNHLRVIDFGLSKYAGIEDTANCDRNVGKDGQEDDGTLKSTKSDVKKRRHRKHFLNFLPSLKQIHHHGRHNLKSHHTTSNTSNEDTATLPTGSTGIIDGTKNFTDEERLYSKHFRYLTSVVGTPYYVAPEILTQQQQPSTTPSDNKDDTIQVGYTSKCDIWSIGVLAFLTLTGTLPVMGKDERETVQKLMDPDLEVDFSDETLWQQDHDADDTINDTQKQGDKHNQTMNKNNKKKISSSARRFCMALLQRDPKKRTTVREALQFDWIVKHCGELPSIAEAENRHRRCLPSLSAF